MSEGSLARILRFVYFSLEEDYWKGTKRTIERKTWRKLERNSAENFKRTESGSILLIEGYYSFNHYPFENWLPYPFSLLIFVLFYLLFQLFLSSPTLPNSKKKNQDLTYISTVSTSLYLSIMESPPSRGRLYLHFKAICYSQDSKVTHSQKMVGNPVTY